MKKLLFIAPVFGMKPFVNDLSFELEKKDYQIDILDHEEHKIINFNDGTYKKLPIYLAKLIPYSRSFFRLWLMKRVDKQYKKVYTALEGKYDVTLILFHFDKLNKYAEIISKTSKKLVVSYAGSDFYNVPNFVKTENKQLLDKTDIIAFNNPYMKIDFINYYQKYKEKVKITGFGIKYLKRINNIKEKESTEVSKKLLDIPTDKVIISVGYNRDRRHKQLDFLDKLSSIDKSLKEKVFVIFPMTYIKSPGYLEEVSLKAKTLNISHKIFKERLSDDDICRIRIVPDITVHISTMDQSSASMLEHLYSGNVLITGKWLPYDFWDDLGIYSHRENDENIAATIEKTLKNLTKEKKKSEINKQIIYDKYVWKNRINKWFECL